MHRTMKWLLALSLVVLLAPLCPADAEEASASIEAGVNTVNIDDNKTRVNEYSTTRPDDGTGAYGKVTIEGEENGFYIDLMGDIQDKDTINLDLGMDFMRRVRVETKYEEFTHWLDHDKLNYLNAAVPGANLFAVDNPGSPTLVSPGLWNLGTDPDAALNPNNVPAFVGLGDDGNYYATNNSPPAAPDGVTVAWQQIGRAGLYGEDFVPNEDFYIVHKEFENKVDMDIFPNVTLHAGYRLEKREGRAQAIGMSKCTTCHITGSSKEIDEKTEDLSFGATGKFGLLTLDYTFTTREFRNDAADPTRVYDAALSPSPATVYSPTNGTFDNRLLYDLEADPSAAAIDAAERAYDTTPDSDKDSHVLKARVDLPYNTAVLGSFVTAKVESNKSSDGTFALSDSRLTSTYDGYGLKATTRFMKNLTLNAYVKFEEIETDEVDITFYPMAQTTASLGGVPGTPVVGRADAASRDNVKAGIDGMYRLARYTTARLGYEYKKEDRDEWWLGETETQTFKASLKTRPMKNLTTRLSYMYQSIDEPFRNPDAALYVDPYTGLNYYDKNADPAWTPGYTIGSGPTYGTDYYDLRSLDMTNLPEDVHEAKLSATWSPRADFSATLTYRGRFEENELDHGSWKQTTHSPTLSLWYAPTNRVNLTFAYNYYGQSTESKFCQGWYDG